MPESMVNTLKNVTLFSDFQNNPEALLSISKLMTRASFKRGQELIKQGDKGSEFFVLTKGKVAISKITPEGDSYKVLVLDHLQHPAFGEGGLMGSEVRSATITCETDVECLVLSRDGFDKICQTSPQIAVPIFKKIAHSLMIRLNQTSNDLMMLHKALMDEIRAHD